MAGLKLSMDQSNEKSSFLCFLQDVECHSANLLYLNKLSQNKIEHFSMVSIPFTVSKESTDITAPDVDNRMADDSYASLSNVSYNNMANKPLYSKGSHAEATMAEQKSFKHIDKSKSLYSLHTKYPHNYLLDEEDEFAFKITEFFKSLDDNHVVTFLEEDLECVVESTHHPCLSFPTASPVVDRSESVDEIGNTESSKGRNSMQIIGGHQSEKCNGTDTATATRSASFAYSDHVCCTSQSGSVSHQSDSSTTSTHSFAFPIMPCEWNCSPVKIPEPDPKFFYSKRTWKKCIRDVFCCQ